MEDRTALLERNGWEVECESPWEIRKKDTGDFATGEAALCVIEIVRQEDEKAEKIAEAIRIQAIVGKWIEFIKFHTKYTDTYQNWPILADALHSSLLRRMLAGEEPMSEVDYIEWRG